GKGQTSQFPEGNMMPRGVGDLMYMPLGGMPGFELKYKNSDRDVTVTVNDFEVFTSEGSDSEVALVVYYGITDNLALGIEQAIALALDSGTSYGPASVNDGQTVRLSREGLRDPTLGIKYRATTQRVSSYQLDVSFKVS